MPYNDCICPVCNTPAKDYREGTFSRSTYDCYNCGKYLIYDDEMYLINKMDKNKLAPFLYYHSKIPILNNEEKIFYIGNEGGLDSAKKAIPTIKRITIEDINLWFPISFNEKINLILLGLEKQSGYIGYEVPLSDEEVKSLFFVKRFLNDGKLINHNLLPQIKLIANYLLEQKLISLKENLATILPDGWKRIDELQKNQSISKQVFIAIAFSGEMEKVQKEIEKGIIDAGYEPHVMNKNKHNNQIVPEILFQIKQSKFVVAEFSTNNNGAYYEAGYAAGLGKEVIHICNKKMFKRKGHFDIKQKSTVLWETIDEISELLKKHIEATIGKREI